MVNGTVGGTVMRAIRRRKTEVTSGIRRVTPTLRTFLADFAGRESRRSFRSTRVKFLSYI
jgi:hypothetical protein